MAAKENNECHGGLTGINYAQIIDSYAVSSGSGGAVCGINKGKIVRCYGNSSSNCVSYVKVGKETDSWALKNISALQEKDIITWDFKRTWTFSKNGLPIFKSDSWYADNSLKKFDLIIDTANKLEDFANQIWAGNQDMARKNVLIAADINLKNKKIKPIGTSDNPYTGTFDGAGHVISNLKIVAEKNTVAGMFGVITRARICNLTVKGDVYGGSDTGVLCGVNDLSEILCCSTIGEVHGYGSVGGLCGNNRGIINRCSFYGYIRRKKCNYNFKWLLPICAILLLEVGTISALAMTSPNTEWSRVYKPVAKEKSIKPIVYDRSESEGTTTSANSVTIKVNSQATYYGGEKLALVMSNPSVSNQNAVMEVLIAEEYVNGEITYEEAKVFNAQYNYCVVAKTGAIPPGYKVDEFNWLGYPEDSLTSGNYPAFVKIYFYDVKTNEKSLLDSLFGITLKIEE